ncbi:TonB family protein [Actomonas aquatica]|uniref:TonB family protein n=1 Tax=Actomonas aquatica TaxID=2866162 RepID=A0ABZ1C3D4_9BACT|nr:TonB family protein [Opitutus sp. WL0086]WRQ86216.1 TonB family protein [Opitutus sp. WL0086]
MRIWLRWWVVLVVVGGGLFAQGASSEGEIWQELETVFARDRETDRNDGAGRRKIFEAYARLAEQGVAAASWRLGQMWEEGDGGAVDTVKARECYAAAVDAGLAAANFNRGLLALQGLGEGRDVAVGVAHITAAAESGYVPAQRVLARIHADDRFGVEDPTKALRWAREAAAQDDAAGQVQVGDLVTQGIGIERDVLLARDWYQLSAEQDYGDAMLMMGKSLIDSGDPLIGMQWLELAGSAGNLDAAFLTAVVGMRIGRDEVAKDDPTANAVVQALLLGAFQTLAEKGQGQAIEVVELVAAGDSLFEAVEYVMETSHTERMRRRFELAARRTVETPNGTIEPPKIIHITEIEIPVIAELGEVTGEAQVKMTINFQGKVIAVDLMNPLHPALEAAVRKAVLQWRFEPAKINGEPMAVQTTFTVSLQHSRLKSLGGGVEEQL